MPHSGYIKRFVLEDTGYKLYFNEDLPFITILENNPEKYNPLPIISLVIRNNFIMDDPTIEMTEIVEIGMLNIHLKPYYDNVVIAGYSFTSNIVGGTGKYKLNAKDIINVKSEISTFEGEGDRYGHNFRKRGYRLDDMNDFYTYLVTISIELDPL